MSATALDPDASKYSRGLVGVVAGGEPYPGAAVLCVAGARRGGAGYVHHVSADDFTRALVVQRFPDVVTCADLDSVMLSRAAAVVIGSGIRPGHDALLTMVTKVLASAAIVVLDGGALDEVANNADLVELIHQRSEPVVITPHLGEARRMLPQLPLERSEAALALAHHFGAVTLLKGSGTVVATPSAVVYVDHIGGPELATAGTGDVLAGLSASMLAAASATASAPLRHEDVAAVASDAVRAHSLAGKHAASAVFSVTALDVADALGAVMRGLRT